MLSNKVEISQQVISALQDELNYQSNMQAIGRADSVDHGVAGQIVTLVQYTNEVVEKWTKNAGEEEALDALRKVAAIAIRALETNGCPRRQ